MDARDGYARLSIACVPVLQGRGVNPLRVDSWPFPPRTRIKPQEFTMPTMSNQRRKKIQLKQRKAKNAASRAAKIAKKAANEAKKSA